MTIKQLQDDIALKSKGLDVLLSKEVSSLTDDEITSMEVTNKEIEGLTEKLQQLNNVEQIKLKNAQRMNTSFEPKVGNENVYSTPRKKESKYFENDADANAFGEYIRSKGRDTENFTKQFGHEMTTKASTAFDSFNAGFLVTPPTVVQTIINATEEQGVALREVNVQQMNSQIEYINTITEDSVVMYYGAEGVAATQTDIGAGRSQLTAKIVKGTTEVSDQLLASGSVNVADVIIGAFAKAYGKTVDEAVFSNTGVQGTAQGGTVSIPQSLLSLGTEANTPSIQGTGGWSAITLPNLRTFISLLPTSQLAGAKFYMSRQAFALVFQRLLDAAGGNSGLYYQEGQRRFFDGYEIVFTDKLATADANPTNIALFGNLRNVCTVGVRKSFGMQMNEYIKQAEGLIQFNFKAEHDVATYNLGVNSATAGNRRVGGVALLRRNA